MSISSPSVSQGPLHIFSVYAPTLCSTAEDKDVFYYELDAKIGITWPHCIGHFGVGKLNENRQRLLELCSYHNLCITNTFFPTKPHHRVSWRHPRSRHWHQLDFIVTRRSMLKHVLVTRAYHSADCDTDHSLVSSKVRFQPRRTHRSKQKGHPRINTARTSVPELRKRFARAIDEALEDCPVDSVKTRWEYIRDTVYKVASDTFGKKVKKSEDWFEAGIEVLEPAITAKRATLLEYKRQPSARTMAAFREARNNTKRIARKCVNDYWLKLCSDIQTSADCGNIRAMYEGMKKAFCPSAIKTAPLKSTSGEIITDRSKQMERWAEHYQELYSRENIVTDTAIRNIMPLPIMEELDSPPTIEELGKAIDSLACGKAPGSEGIPSEIIKAGKNKGDRSDCNNYRGISLLSVVGKAFARVILTRLQLLADRVYPESQCGFRAKRSTIDMVFTLRQLQEKCREQRRPLFLAFIDLTKAFDMVSRTGLFTLLHRIGCPPKLLKLIISFHENMAGTVQYGESFSDPFPIRCGVKQGCVLAPTLFGMFFSLLLRYAFCNSEDGIFLHTRSDGNVFNLARLRAKTKVRKVLIREMLFADDTALAAHTEGALQRLITCFADACTEFGIAISLKKTNILAQDVSTTPAITIGDHTLEVVENFTYLGSTICSNLDTELNIRIGKAATAMAQLAKRVWDNTLLTLKTKLKVYQACVLSTLLYGSEAWTLYSRQEQRLNAFHMRMLTHSLSGSYAKYVHHPYTETTALAWPPVQDG
ncbi:RNA-directed DNA polymerase from mobile element jockey-like protein [Labeo rohita]|uniref:RNA-directed DNA polymerase from mobile element jockey-like protein n=1 Tax=Labeo rohita TaxID=84645 RepID=A0A498NVM0_LABRO|nr:RNA-directed DNA polymerase from mobile element jockey-like protein [Labeo rohita]